MTSERGATRSTISASVASSAWATGSPFSSAAAAASSVERSAASVAWLAASRSSDDALRRLAAHVDLAGVELARDLVAPAGEDVDPRLDRPLRRADDVDRELAGPADAVVVGVDRRERRLAPGRLAVLPEADDGAQDLVAVAEDVGRDRDDVAYRALDRPATFLDRGPDELDADARRRRLGSRSGGHVSALFPICSVPNVTTMTFRRSSGVQLHLTSLPGGRLGPQAYRFVDWLEAAGQAWWQVLPLGPPDRARSPYKARSAFAAWPGFLADRSAPVSREEADAFRAGQAAWIEDWAAFAGGTRAVNDQVRFDREWAALRSYAAERGVRLIGDVPIYVAPGSADHVAHPELFRDDVVAGAPPDYFTAKGQLWGNPIYDWPALRRRGYRFWIERFRRTFDLFDLARVDHFRGFAAYWAIPRGAPDARPGKWVRGPGRAPFDAARARARLRSPDHRRGPRRDHPAGRPAARRARLPRHGRPPVRLQPRRPQQPARPLPPPRATRSSTPARTTTTRCAAGTRACPRSASPSCARRACAGDSPGGTSSRSPRARWRGCACCRCRTCWGSATRRG